MPLGDSERHEFCAGMAAARRLLLGEEPLSREHRDNLAGLLEQFEASFLAMDTATAQLRAILHRGAPHP